MVSNAWRAAASFGVEDSVCNDEKNDCITLVIPVPLSDNNLSTWLTWLRYAWASLLSDVVSCSCLSR
ncbi:hypothetical protein D3C73_1429900 [compost metagenome]